jgi:tRNA-binding protein
MVDNTMQIISYADFEKIEIRSGTIIKAEIFERAKKPAFKIWVDFGPYGILQTSSQVTHYYSAEVLLNKKVLGCINLGIKNIAGFKSEFLLLGCCDDNDNVVLPEFLIDIPNGAKLA